MQTVTQRCFATADWVWKPRVGVYVKRTSGVNDCVDATRTPRWSLPSHSEARPFFKRGSGMAKLVSGMNQSLDGYVTIWPLRQAPQPARESLGAERVLDLPTIRVRQSMMSL